MRPDRLGVAALLVLAAACTVDPEPEPSPPSPPPTVTATTTPAPPEPGTVAPDWLGTRPLPLAANGLGEVRPTPDELRTRRFTLPDTAPALPGDGWASRVEDVPRDVLDRSTWSRRCPVDADDLRWVRVAFWGFDDARHTGELLVNAEVVDDVVSVFERLYTARFPIEEMRITRADELDAAPTGDGNNTGAFTCRPSTGGEGWSEHAYGLAVDINPFHNPYVRGDVLIPELAGAYTDREREAPGMITEGDVVTRAFAAVRWGWGGDWQRSSDPMHFSRNGR